MMHTSKTQAPRALPARSLQAMGSVGAFMALAILAMSALLRLTTVFDADGHTISTLPAVAEDTARLIHRLAASTVGLLALAAPIVCWRYRKDVAQAVVPVAGIVAATLLLTLIGPLTPGYRFTIVTAATIVGGTALLASCWWLRERLANVRENRRAPGTLLKATLLVVFIHIVAGATASAFALRGIHGVSIVHQLSALLLIVLLGAILWDKGFQSQHPRLHTVMTWLLYAQLALGFTLLLAQGHLVWLALAHALCSPLLVAGLVSMAVRD
jgi:heme A synthase